MNPMLQLLNRNNPASQIMQIKQLLNGKDPNQFAAQMMRNNPQFAEFMRANQGKSPEQIAIENGIDPNLLKMR